MAHWELGPRLAAKYPWLRVDSSTMDEFRAPFDWSRSSSSSSCSSASSAAAAGELDARREPKRGLSGPKRGTHAKIKLRKKKTGPNGESVKGFTTASRGNRARRRRRVESPSSTSHNQVAACKSPATGEETLVRLPAASWSKASPLSPMEADPFQASGSNSLQSSAWLAVRADFDATTKPRRARKQRDTHKTQLQTLSLQKTDGTPNARKTAVNADLQALAKELDELHKDEERLKNDVAARIEAERAKLPLTFLFQRNLELQSYCKEKGVATITQIFAKLQHRLLFSAFERWQIVNEFARKEERKQLVLEQSRTQAVKLFERLANDAYVGTIDRAFRRWWDAAQSMVDAERNNAAAVIQGRFRRRRALVLATVLKQASLDAEYKRKVEIQRLLRFESYGTTMLWSALRLGFNMVIQNHCARRIQFFFRRIAVEKRVHARVMQSQAATKIQTQWRMRLARSNLDRKRAEATRQRAQEEQAATVIQCQARRLAAKRKLLDLQLLRLQNIEAAQQIQQWWRRCKSRWVLKQRFADRKRILKMEYERLERLRLETLEEQRRQDAILLLQRVARGWLARQEYRRRTRAKCLDLAARRVQASWRKSKGRYALHLRFVAQGNRVEERRSLSALKIQCCYRIFVAKSRRCQLQYDFNRRRVAAIVIQSTVRQYVARKRYRHKRRSAIIVQNGMRTKMANLQRQRLLFEREQRQRAALIIQCWARSIAARARLKVLRKKKHLENVRRKQSAIIIQKRARGVEVRNMLKLLKDAITTIELEQSRHCQAVRRQCSSELLDFVTKHYFANPEAVSTTRFTAFEYDWLVSQVAQSKEQMEREDQAIVFLQRYYRGYVCRAAFWVMKLQQQERRALEQRTAIVIQRIIRGFLGRRSVRRHRQQRKMEQIKAKYIQERRWKDLEQQWQEQYQREQLEIQIRRAKQLEIKLIHAKREAELAKFQAEAAMYRRQEQELLSEERKISQPRGGDDDMKRERAQSKWETLNDEYGNAYYFNPQTGESRWDLPPEEIMPDSPAPDIASTEEELEAQSTSRAKSEEDFDSQKRGVEQVIAVKPHQDEAHDREDTTSVCGVCKMAQATRECVDCNSNSKPSIYCTFCFTQDHYGELAAPGKRGHDFKVLVKTEVRSRCRSHFGCHEGGEMEERSLATYFCYECYASAGAQENTAGVADSSVVAHDSSSVLPLPGQESGARGCFYCDECFAQAHETAQELQHVANALRFKKGAHLCSECSAVVAFRYCEQCDERFCAKCFQRIHTNSSIKREHTFSPIEITKEDLESDKDAYCIECDVRRSVRMCNLCGDGFCEQCFKETHAKGAKQSHTWIPWSNFAQVGDWIEIWDEKAGSKIFFNVETKESTAKQPFVLKPGIERHQLQLAEREQLHKRRELELESELVKLREQLKEKEESDARRAQRLPSRSSPFTDPGSQQPGVQGSKGTTGSKEPTKKKKKKGIFSRLLSRSNKVPDATEKELTEEEKKRKQLVDGVQDSERELILTKMKTRVREEKEAKARETIGTTQFQQAMVQELAQSKFDFQSIATALSSDKVPSCIQALEQPDASKGAAEVLMDSDQSPSASEAKQYPSSAARRHSTSRRSSVKDPRASESDEISEASDHKVLIESLFDADNVAMAMIEYAIDVTIAQSLERFYNERLAGYVAESTTRALLEAIAPVINTRDFGAVSRDPLETALLPASPRVIEREPSRSCVDSYARSEIPIRDWRRESEVYYGDLTASKQMTPPQTPRTRGKGEKHGLPPASRPSSLCSFKQHKKPYTVNNAPAAISSGTAMLVEAAIAPGVVFSTAPPDEPPRSSPRKSIALLRNAHRLSIHRPKTEPSAPPADADDGTGIAARDNDAGSFNDQDARGSQDGPAARRGRRATDVTNPHACGGSFLNDKDESVRAPVEVEYSIRRQSPRKKSSAIFVPDLSTPLPAADNANSSGDPVPSDWVEDRHFVIDPTSQSFQTMPLSPGVKLQEGEMTKLGPDLPLFSTRMRKSTFYEIDALSLSAALSAQSPNTPKSTPGTPQQLPASLSRTEEERRMHTEGLGGASPKTVSVFVANEEDRHSSRRGSNASRTSDGRRASTSPLVCSWMLLPPSLSQIGSLNATSTLCTSPVLQAAVKGGSPMYPHGRQRLPAAQPLPWRTLINSRLDMGNTCTIGSTKRLGDCAMGTVSAGERVSRPGEAARVPTQDIDGRISNAEIQHQHRSKCQPPPVDRRCFLSCVCVDSECTQV